MRDMEFRIHSQHRIHRKNMRIHIPRTKMVIPEVLHTHLLTP